MTANNLSRICFTNLSVEEKGVTGFVFILLPYFTCSVVSGDTFYKLIFKSVVHFYTPHLLLRNPGCHMHLTLKLYLIFSQISTHRHFVSIRKKAARTFDTNPRYLRPLLTLNLRTNFHTIAEGENYHAVRIDCCIIHKPVKQLHVEIHRQFLHLAKSRFERNFRL